MITLTGPATSVSFRNPDVVNKYSLDTQAIIRYTRGQKVITYKNTNWKSIETEVLAFNHIREAKRAEIEIFLRDNIGLEITITKPRRDNCNIVDHTFTGYIYSDAIDYTNNGNVYAFGLVLLYKISAIDLKYLLTESGTQLITEAGDKLKIEAD